MISSTCVLQVFIRPARRKRSWAFSSFVAPVAFAISGIISSKRLRAVWSIPSRCAYSVPDSSRLVVKPRPVRLEVLLSHAAILAQIFGSRFRKSDSGNFIVVHCHFLRLVTALSEVTGMLCPACSVILYERLAFRICLKGVMSMLLVWFNESMSTPI